MSPTKNIYVREADQEVWMKAEQIAGTSLSAVVTDALREYVAAREIDTEGMERIEVDCWDANETPFVKAFHGKWLAAPDYDRRDGNAWGLAQTKRGNYVVYATDMNGRSTFDVFDDFDEAADAVPDYIARAARQELTGGGGVEELDI